MDAQYATPPANGCLPASYNFQVHGKDALWPAVAAVYISAAPEVRHGRWSPGFTPRPSLSSHRLLRMMSRATPSPASQPYRAVLGPQQDVVEHMRALPHRDVAAAIETVRASGAAPVVKLAFEFLVLTGARSGEVRGAQWAEIDTANHVWTVPATRTKAKREHHVPLSRRAERVLDAARKLSNGTPYPRSDLFERRRQLMNDWAAYLYGNHRTPRNPPIEHQQNPPIISIDILADRRLHPTFRDSVASFLLHRSPHHPGRASPMDTAPPDDPSLATAVPAT